MQRIQITCTGVSPLLMNPATPELIESLRTKTPMQKARDKSREAEAADKLIERDGVFGIPVEYLLASLAEAGRHVTTTGRSKISTASSTQLFAFLSIEEDFLPFPADCQEWVPDLRRGRNPNGGEMVALVRPKFMKWSVTFHVLLDNKLLDKSKLRELIVIAGRQVGLADFRPSCKGPFGRSKVTAFKVLEEFDDDAVVEDEPVAASANGNGHGEVHEMAEVAS